MNDSFYLLTYYILVAFLECENIYYQVVFEKSHKLVGKSFFPLCRMSIMIMITVLEIWICCMNKLGLKLSFIHMDYEMTLTIAFV